MASEWPQSCLNLRFPLCIICSELDKVELVYNELTLGACGLFLVFFKILTLSPIPPPPLDTHGII